MALPGFIAAAVLAGMSRGHAPATTPRDAVPAVELADAKTIFPGVRADLNAGVVEVDAEVTGLLVKDEKAPLFYLEVVACIPDTREHETLLVVKARPSHVHAALLALGLKPGKPGGWALENDRLTPTPPIGERVDVRFVYAGTGGAGGTKVEADPLSWIVSAKDRSSFAAAQTAAAQKEGARAPGWVFAGSVLATRKDAKGNDAEVYDADGSGTLVGLTTFGSEVIAWSRVISPEASVQEPEWVADLSRTPAPGTPVTIRIRRAE